MKITAIPTKKKQHDFLKFYLCNVKQMNIKKKKKVTKLTILYV